jgi:hypothetical protein
MTMEERVLAVEALGFSPRQAQFLVTVALHSGPRSSSPRLGEQKKSGCSCARRAAIRSSQVLPVRPFGRLKDPG